VRRWRDAYLDWASVLVLSRAQVEQLLDRDALIEAVAAAMAALSAGRAASPARVAVLVPERGGVLAAMPGHLPDPGALTTKLVTVFPQNAGTALPTHQAVIVAFDPDTGQPVALLDGEAITAARTAAGSALSARLLAREDAAVLAVLGTGVQARAHVDAVRRVRPIRRVRIAGRARGRAEALAAELATEPAAIEVTVADSYPAALEGADIVCATTHAAEPVIRREWIGPGTHVTSVGFNPAGAEIDDATFLDALLCVEARDVALAPFPTGCPALNRLCAQGRLPAAAVHAELGELVSGARAGRSSAEQITLYRSVGVAVQDTAAAALVLAAARRAGTGTTIAL
jgi:ornithine cyclodeaminase